MLTDKELQVLMLRKKGLLQTEIAKQLGMTQSAISRFEASATRKAQEAKRQLDLLHKLGIDIAPAEDTEARLRKLQGVKR